MTGRQEDEIKLKNKIQKMLIDKPIILKKYYAYMGENKTEKTKNLYILGLIRYNNFLIINNHTVEDFDYLQNQKKTDINEYIEELKYRNVNGKIINNSRSNIRTNLYAVKSFFEFLEDEEYITKNPFYNFKFPKLNEIIEVRPIEKSDIREIKANIRAFSKNPERDEAIFVIGIKTGLRASAITEINISDINWEDHTIKVTEKGNVTRLVYFGENTETALIKWLDVRKETPNCDALFINNRGQRINYSIINRMLKKYGLGNVPHNLRKTYGTNLYDESGDIYLTAEGLGHKNIQNTKRYARVSEKKKLQAARLVDKI